MRDGSILCSVAAMFINSSSPGSRGDAFIVGHVVSGYFCSGLMPFPGRCCPIAHHNHPGDQVCSFDKRRFHVFVGDEAAGVGNASQDVIS